MTIKWVLTVSEQYLQRFDVLFIIVLILRLSLYTLLLFKWIKISFALHVIAFHNNCLSVICHAKNTINKQEFYLENCNKFKYDGIFPTNIVQ